MKTINHHLLSIVILLIVGSAVQAQVKIGVNPQQIVSGAKLQVDGTNSTGVDAKFIVNGSGNTGVGTANPGTTLDVNGAITNREVQVTVSSNAVTIPANTSMARITGAATAIINISAPAAPNSGQRLIIFNNSTGGYGSLLNSISVPNGAAVEFVYSNGAWRGINVIYAPAIIPYASSSPVILTTIAGGLVGTGAMVGFGNSVFGVSLSAGSIDITGGAGLNMNFGFTAPRDGTLRSISGYFSASAAISLIATNVTIKAQLYQSNSITSNLFSPVAGAQVTLTPNFTGGVSLGTTCSGITTGLSIPISAQSRYLLVFSSTASGLTLITSITGYASGGLSIE